MWKGIQAHKVLDPITHLQFVDDMILFGEALEQEALVIKSTLEQYVEVSSQCMNKIKSQVFFVNTNKRLQYKIAKILEFQIVLFPTKYLGVPLFMGRSNNLMWEEIINKHQAKTSLWKNKWLSQVGRIQMIKYVLSMVPIYSMSYFRLSVQAIGALDGLLKKHLWEGSKEARRIPLIYWDTAYLLKEEGGAGLRKIDL